MAAKIRKRHGKPGHGPEDDLEVANEMIQSHGLSGVRAVRAQEMGGRRDHTAGRVE